MLVMEIGTNAAADAGLPIGVERLDIRIALLALGEPGLSGAKLEAGDNAAFEYLRRLSPGEGVLAMACAKGGQKLFAASFHGCVMQRVALARVERRQVVAAEVGLPAHSSNTFRH